MRKPLAPFGRELYDLLLRGYHPRNDIFIFVGIWAFRKAKSLENMQYVLALPYGKDSSDYRWPVKDCSVLVFNSGDVQLAPITLRKLGYILLASGAVIVRLALEPQLVVYRGEAK